MIVEYSFKFKELNAGDTRSSSRPQGSNLKFSHKALYSFFLYICWRLSMETICIKPVKGRSHEGKVNIAFILSVKVNISLHQDKIRKKTK